MMMGKNIMLERSPPVCTFTFPFVVNVVATVTLLLSPSVPPLNNEQR